MGKASELIIQKALWRFSIGESFRGEMFYGVGDVIIGGLHRGAVVGLSIQEPLWEPLHREPLLGKRSSGNRSGKKRPQGSHIGPRPSAGGVSDPNSPQPPARPPAPLLPQPRVPDGGRPAARAAGGPCAGQSQPVWGVHVHGCERRRRTAPLRGSLRPAGRLLARYGRVGRLGVPGGRGAQCAGARRGRGHVGGRGRSRERGRSWTRAKRADGGVGTGWGWGQAHGCGSSLP